MGPWVTLETNRGEGEAGAGEHLVAVDSRSRTVMKGLHNRDSQKQSRGGAGGHRRPESWKLCGGGRPAWH